MNPYYSILQTVCTFFFSRNKIQSEIWVFICDEIGNGAQLIQYDVQFDILTTMKITVFWDTNVCSLVGSYQSLWYTTDGNSMFPWNIFIYLSDYIVSHLKTQ